MVPDIPVDVWLYIAQFLPREDLKAMLSVNSLFYEVAMNARYSDVYLKDRQPSTIRILQRLADPIVGRRVRSLHMRLQEYRKTSPPAELDHGSLIQALYRSFATFAPSSSRAQKTPDPTSFAGFIQALIGAFPSLVNLREFCIDAWDVPSDFDLVPFYSAAWTGFGLSLERVTLGGNLEGYRVLTMTNPPLHALQELFIEFTNDGFNRSRAHTNSAEILSQNVGSFLRTVAPQLRVLSLQSWASLDLSSFFLNLPPFPCLQYFRIRTPFNVSFNSDPSGLGRFLNQVAPTLRTLELRLNPSGAVLNVDIGEVLGRWLHDTLLTISAFDCLKTLHLYPTTSATGIEALIVAIRASQGTLRHLAVKDRYLQFEETERIILALGDNPGLLSLRLSIWHLQADLIHLLASRLPELKELTLYIAEAQINDLSSPRSQVFLAEMKTRVYSDWKLWNIGLWQGGARVHAQIMSVLLGAIPALGSFWDTGSLNPDAEEPQSLSTFPHYHYL